MKSIPRIILCALLLAGGDAALAENAIPPRITNPTEWYVKTIVTVVNPADGRVIQDTRSGVFGQLADSVSTQDRHDIPAWASTAASPAALVFVHGAEWGDKAGEYLSDYHPPNKMNDSWTFTVRSNLGSPNVTLSWDGLFALEPTPVGTYTETRDPLHTLFKRLRLIDLMSGKVIKPSNFLYQKKHGNTYTFDMRGGTSRQFRWVLGPVRREHFALSAAPVAAKTNRTKSPLQARQAQAAQQTLSSDRFGTPPAGAPQTGATR